MTMSVADPVAASLPAEDRNLRILVVEDSPVQRRFLVELLHTLLGCTVLEADNGSEALERLRADTADVHLVISDLAMPGMDGMAFLRHLAELRPASRVIVASSQRRAVLDSVEIMARAQGLRTLGVIRKPVNEARLSVLLQRLRGGDVRRRALAEPDTVAIGEIVTGLEQEQFFAVYQPKVAFGTGRVVGAEALARWRHPVRGLVSPAQFIPAMERHGILERLTWLMLREAAKACRGWRAAGHKLSVSVNLSMSDLGRADLAEHVHDTVRTTGLHPRHVILEITEQAAMSDLARTLETLTRLRIIGFELSIDDFGTGYSSLQQLSRIPFSELKIDQSLVTGAAERDSLRAILESSLDMAKRLRISATAEGIESQQDWNLLRRLRCDLAQGYLIARPMEDEALHRWLGDPARTSHLAPARASIARETDAAAGGRRKAT